MGCFPAFEPPPYDNLEAKPSLSSPVSPQYGHSILRESWQVAGKGAITSLKCGATEKWLYCKCCGAKPITTHCDKPLCPVCYEIWAKKRAKMISERLISVVDAWKDRGKRMLISHYTLSVPPSYYELFKTELGYRQIRKDAYKILKRSGLAGGVLVVHSHRQEKEGNKEWFFSPHFHVLGAGYIQHRTALNAGWFLKKIRQAEEPFGVARYMLSHAGIFQPASSQAEERRTVNTICWFGLFSTAWVRVDIRREFEEVVCECGARLYEDAEFTTEAWRLLKCYSYRLKPIPPPVQMVLEIEIEGTVA